MNLLPYYKKYVKLTYMRGMRNIFKFVFILVVFCLTTVQCAFCESNTKSENYLLGMSIRKTYSGYYSVQLKLQKEPPQKFRLQELGNNSYVVILPQVKKVIENSDINYETGQSDIKAVVSEKTDLSDKNIFYTKINFRTKEPSFIIIETYVPREVKTQVVLNKDPEEIEEEEKDNYIPEWVWFLPVLFLSAICIWLMLKRTPPEEDPEQKLSGYEYIPVTERNSFFKTITPPSDTFSCQERDPSTHENEEYQNLSIKDLLEKSKNRSLQNPQEEVDTIIDELVKIVIPKNDLILMPGVPELPGLENKDQTSKMLYIKPKEQIVIPDKNSTSEVLKNSEAMKEADSIIFAEKDIFFDNISAINDIPKHAGEEILKAPQTEEEADYEVLMKKYKKILSVAHKLDDTENVELDLIDLFAIDKKRSFCLIQAGDKISLVGNILNTVFLLRTFTKEEINNEPLYMEFCNKTEDYSIYAVIINEFKALVKISETDISLIGEYD